MLSTEIDARIVRENSNDLEDLHRFDKSGKRLVCKGELMIWRTEPAGLQLTP